MQIHELTALARQMKASDIHISQGLPLMFRIDGVLREAPVQYDADTTRALIESMLDEAHREALDLHRLDAEGRDDGTCAIRRESVLRISCDDESERALMLSLIHI